MKHLNAANKLKTFGMENRKNCSQIIKDEKSFAFHNPHVIQSVFLVPGLKWTVTGLEGVNQIKLTKKAKYLRKGKMWKKIRN